MSALTLSAKLERVDKTTPWGFRLQGGKDFSSPLTIQRVTPGSLAAKCGLELGDVIKKIGDLPCDNLKHKEAQQAIISASNSLELTLQRGGVASRPPPPSAVAPSYQPQPPYQPPTQTYNAAPKPFSAGGPASQEPKVPVAVNKQYNTPINLYSVDNVVDSLSTQTQAMSMANQPPAGNNSPYSATHQAVHEQTSWSAPEPQHDRHSSWSASDQSHERQSSWSAIDQSHERQSSWSSTDTNPSRLSQQPPRNDSPVTMESPPRLQTRPSSQAQSRSFKMLQSMINDSEDEDLEPSSPPLPPPPPPPSQPPFQPPAANRPQQRFTNPAPSYNQRTAHPLPSYMQSTQPDDSVKALVHSQYNSPLGLYSKQNYDNSLEGHIQGVVALDRTLSSDSDSSFPPPPPDLCPPQSGRTVSSGPLPPPPPVADDNVKVYRPSETYRLVHERTTDDKPSEPQIKSRTFRVLQQQLGGPAAGPPPARPAPAPAPVKTAPQQSWGAPSARPAPAAPAPVAAPAAKKPWTPPPRVPGTTRFGKKGDAQFKKGGEPGRVPVCHTCGQAIRGPFVVALDKTWCPDHFICANTSCGTQLTEIGFVEENGQIYCERDYERYFAPPCGKCKRPIVGECVNALNNTYHPHCFLCAHCRQPIGTGSFHMEDGQPYCEKDWQSLYQTKCSGCQFPIEPGDRWVEALGGNFHSECFNCSVCQVNLEGQGFYAKGGKPYCKRHA